jgi:Glycine zipper
MSGYYGQGQGGYPPYNQQGQGYPPQQGGTPYPTDPNQHAYGHQPQYGQPQTQYGQAAQYQQPQGGYPQQSGQPPYDATRGASYPAQGQYPGQPGEGQPGERGLVGGAIAGSLLGGIGSKLTGHSGGKGALVGAIVGGLAGHHKKEKKKKHRKEGQRGYSSSSDSD